MRTGNAAISAEDFRIEPDEYRQLDDERVLVLDHGSGRGKTSRLEIGQMSNAANLFHVRHGTVHLVLYFDRGQAITDLGLSPEGEAAPD